MNLVRQESNSKNEIKQRIERKIYKKKVVFDIDDTLNELLHHSFKLAGVDIEKYFRSGLYSLSLSTELSDADRKKVMDIWKCHDTYTNCPAQPRIEEIEKLCNDKDVELIVHSKCENEQAMLSKMEWIEEHIKSKNIKFNMEIGQKNPILGAYAVVEDNLEYLITCKADIKIIIDKPYNKSENYGFNDKDYGLIRLKSTYDAIKYIEEAVENDRGKKIS